MEDGIDSPADWREVVEAIPGGVGVQVEGAFVHVSEPFAATVGSEVSALVGEPWSSLFDPEEAARLEHEALDAVRADGRWEGRAWPRSREGPVDLVLSATDGGAVVWAVSGSDTAPTGQSLQAKRDPRSDSRPAFLRGLFDVLDDVVYVVDEGGRLRFWNEALVETTGYGHAELDEMAPGDLLPEDQRGELRGLLETATDARDRRIEVDLLTKAGEPIPHEFRATVLEDPDTGERFRCGVARDVTERRERERELERYERIVETVDDGVYALDEELRFTFVNDGLCELLERPREEFLGMPVMELFTDAEEAATAEERRHRAVESDAETGSIRATITTSEGERILESRYRLDPETNGEFQGSVGTIRDVTEVQRLQRELREERRFVENVVDALDDVLYVVDGDGNFAFWNEALCERFGYDDEEVAALDPNVFLTEAEADQLPDDPSEFVDVPDRHNVVDLRTADGELVTHELRGVTYEDETTGERYRVGIGRDITDQLERERAIERQRDELATLDRINTLLLDTVRELVQTASREAIERTICERLAASDLYQFAWVGERELDGTRVVPRITAGEDDGYLDDVTITTDDSETGRGPVGRAMETGDVQVATVDDPSFEPWRDAAIERGVEAVAGVPIQHEGTVYGVLVVYATREQAFSPREQDGFDVLGRTVGFAIHATRRRELLFTDTVLELEFRIAGTGSALVSVATELDCDLALEGYVPADDLWVLYLSVDGARPESVVARASEDPRIEHARVVSEAGTNGRVELVVGASSLLHAVTDAGATVRSAVASADDARITVEAPLDADARAIVEHVRDVFPHAQLVARRERDRAAATGGRPDGLLADLTERQREALEAAYHGGYFEWPRESTAEEVADSLGLASSTLHGHLRRAEAAILSALLEDRIPSECPDP